MSFATATPIGLVAVVEHARARNALLGGAAAIIAHVACDLRAVMLQHDVSAVTSSPWPRS